MIEQQIETVIEALGVGASRQLAADAAGVSVFDLYAWLNKGHLEPDSIYAPIAKRLIEAETAGAAHRDRVARMRKIVERHDEAWAILEARAKQYNLARQNTGKQMDLLHG